MTPKQLRWKRWYEAAKANPEWAARRKAQKAAAYQRNKAAGTLKSYERKPEQRRATSRRFYANHREAEQARSRAKNPEQRRAAWHRYATKHRERCLAKKVASESKRRAAKKGCETSQIDFAAIVTAAHGMCGICHEPIGNERTHFDHIVPLARGGAHVQHNLQLAHARCNIRKGARSHAA